MINTLLDKSIVFSFDKTGFARHAKTFSDEKLSAKGKRILVTGGSSGIGLEVVKKCVADGADVTTLSRHPEQVVGNTNKISLDLQDYQGIPNEVQNLKPIDVLINNAGGMPPYSCLPGAIAESIFASQVLGHYVLTCTLIEKGILQKGSRVIFVSSGGMYTRKLNLKDLQGTPETYNKYAAYANAKRAQVIVTEMLSEQYSEIVFSSMHPGWVDTPGVADAMPWFYRLMKRRLRSCAEGADTILWLALTKKKYPSGKFWFDRNTADTHLFKWTHETEEERAKLWQLCQQAIQSSKHFGN